MSKQCRLCMKPLEGARTVFCNDKCSSDYTARNIKNQRKIENLKVPTRWCRYIHCKKPLPPGTNKAVYCKNTDCYKKQNSIDNKNRYRAKAEKQPTTRICELLSCKNEFKVQKNKYRQSYCSEKCRHTALHKKCECGEEIMKTSNYCNSCSVRKRKDKAKLECKPKKGRINPIWLERGCTTYAGYRSLA